jgi:hypothetical protein
VERWSYRGAGGTDAEPSPGERFAILAVRRGARILPMSTGFEAREDDIISVAVHAPESEEAHRILRAGGWELVPASEEA